MKKLIYASIYLPFFLSGIYHVSVPKNPVQTTLVGKNWAYTVPFAVQNPVKLEKLIQCESHGVNVSRVDKGGLYSDGILQFHRGASNILGSGTWSDMEKKFGFYGSPIIPSDAIHMADMMISNGLIGRWTCAHILGLIPI